MSNLLSVQLVALLFSGFRPLADLQTWADKLSGLCLPEPPEIPLIASYVRRADKHHRNSRKGVIEGDLVSEKQCRPAIADRATREPMKADTLTEGV